MCFALTFAASGAKLLLAAMQEVAKGLF